jgi:large subunit ribosomal protein L18
MDNRRKVKARARRVKKVRGHIRLLRVVRLSVHRTSQHIYAQIISADGSQTLASASTVEKTLSGALKSTSNIQAATEVGKLVAERAIKAGIKQVAFDRSGFKYHGRVKALADAARTGGLEF